MPRKAGHPTGRAEGTVLRVIRTKGSPKASPSTQGAQNKFGFLGGDGAPSARVPAGRSRDSGTAGAGGGKRALAAVENHHWHQDIDGKITRGPLSAHDQPGTKHILKLSHEHMAGRVGHVATFDLPHFKFKGDGKITAYGEHGVTVEDAEGKKMRCFYNELTKVEKPKPPKEKKGKKKKEPVVTGGNIRSVIHGIRTWFAKDKEKKAKKKGKK